MGSSISDLVPELQPFANALVDAAGRAGLQPRVTSTLRSHSEQRRLYASYLAGQAGYPVAPPGQSAHEYGLAFDLVVAPLAALAHVGRLWRSWGGGWTGRDAVHFEYPGATKWAKTQPAELNGAGVRGGPFYALADFFSGFVPFLGVAQLADSLVGLLDGNADSASWYLQHPAEAVRDLLNRLLS